MTLKIECIRDDGKTQIHLSDELRSNHIDGSEIEKIFPRLVLDLEEIRVANRDAVRWLNTCQTLGTKRGNDAPYIRAWMFQDQR